MNIFRTRREGAAHGALGSPRPSQPGEAGLEAKIDRRKVNKHIRTKQFNTKVREGFLEDLDRSLEQFCAEKGLETVSRGYFLEVLLYSWMQAKGQDVRPYGLPALALEHAQAIADRMNWGIEQVIVDAIAVRCKDLKIDLNVVRPRT